MDNQKKRGLLDVCVLSAIRDEDGYGWQRRRLWEHLQSGRSGQPPCSG